MKSLLLVALVVPLISVLPVNSFHGEGLEEGHNLDSIAATYEPLNTPPDRLLNIEDNNDPHEKELRNSANSSTAAPSGGDCKSNGGECKKNTKQCKDTITTEFTCSKNGVCCIEEVKIKDASELMQEMLSNVILIQGMAFQTMKDNQANSMVNLTKAIANQELAVQIMNTNFSDAITDLGEAIQIMKSNLSDTILNQRMALQINQEEIMSNLSDGFSNQENMIQTIDDNQEDIMSNLTQYGCPEGFFQLGPSGQCLKFFYDQKRTWSEANTKCANEGLVSAQPSDPAILQRYLVNKYGYSTSKGWPDLWLPARGSGSSYFIWQPTGAWNSAGPRIYRDSPYWYTTPGSSVSSSYCMFMYNQDGMIKSYPGKPYWYNNCSYRYYYTICELVKA